MGKVLATTTAVIASVIFVQTAYAVQISIVPSFQTVSRGDNFTVSISLDPEGSEVFGAQYEVRFNTTLLYARDQARGPFLSQGGATTTLFVNEMNNTIGVIKYGESRTGVESGVTVPGDLATLSFSAIEPGVCYLNLSNVKLSDPLTLPLPVPRLNNGRCEIRAVEATPTPAPTQRSGGVVTPTLPPTSSPAPVRTSSPTPKPAATPLTTVSPPGISSIDLSPSPTPVVTTSATPGSMPVLEEEEKMRRLPGFEATPFIITVVALYLLVKLRNGGDRNE
ncbi:MAG: hypothetical protein EFT35_01740 [Methanophagales archaeon ANME-1-THS]|nr:MAG: hypothetical protein EFT35_01740 [Methanophagales archaeon ANME-1-THS]